LIILNLKQLTAAPEKGRRMLPLHYEWNKRRARF